MDETPLLFEFIDGYTYDLQRKKTITGKTDRSGWGKRQASLILYIFADGVSRIKPLIIFHGKPEGTIRKREGHLYDPRVDVKYMTLRIIMETSLLIRSRKRSFLRLVA